MYAWIDSYNEIHTCALNTKCKNLNEVSPFTASSVARPDPESFPSLKRDPLSYFVFIVHLLFLAALPLLPQMSRLGL